MVLSLLINLNVKDRLQKPVNKLPGSVFFLYFLCDYMDFYMADLPPETPVYPSDSPAGLDLAKSVVSISVLSEVHGSDCKADVFLKALGIKTNLSVKNHFLRFQSTWWKMLSGNSAEAGHTDTFEILWYSLEGRTGFSTLGGATGKAYSGVNQTFRWQVYSLNYKQNYYKIFYFLFLRSKEKFWNWKDDLGFAKSQLPLE